MTEPVCPRCGEDRMVEWDAALRRWTCAVCSWAWAKSVERTARQMAVVRTCRCWREGR